MVVVFANNQVIVAPGPGTSTITTDPVALNNNDRATAMLNCHYIYGASMVANRTLSIVTQVSNDGVVFVPVGTPINISQTTDTPLRDVRNIEGAFIRYQYTFTLVDGPDGGVCFDLHVNLDHQ